MQLAIRSTKQCRSNSALFCMAINSQIKKPVQHPVRCWTTLICGWFSFSAEAYLAFGDHLTHVVPLQALSRTAPASTAGYFYPHLHSISFFRKLQPLFLKREFCIPVAGNHNNVKSYWQRYEEESDCQPLCLRRKWKSSPVAPPKNPECFRIQDFYFYLFTFHKNRIGCCT